ncbi:MAG: hypothetical protein MK036_03225 [Dehalococcoidia bacterium]|jgi:hypothetical protein|nr:hypothetical protein [Dehalococcoidia bacterium]|tara:strand:+ start:644 stop:850 length:207 start_codon:yes stop_codon:yes gene_type:complete
MKLLFRLETLLVLIGLICGLVMGNSFLNIQPAFFGWLFSIGMGISGGAFLAAIVTNIPLVGKIRGPKR